MNDNLIYRQEAIDTFGMVDDAFLSVAVIKARLKGLPAAQTDIIACADCKHWICHDKRCGYWNHGVRPLDWCSHAERRYNDAD